MKLGPAAVLAPAAALVVAALTSCHSRSAETSEDSTAAPVRVRQVKTIERPAFVSASGTVEARHTVDLAFLVAGRVARVGPEEGNWVTAGQVIAEIDSTDYRLGLDAARATADRARDEYGRLKQLFDRGSLAAADYSKVETALRQAEAQEALVAKRLADTRLRAPLTGMVARRGIEPGEQAAPGISVFTIVDLDPIEVSVGVPEAQIARVRAGQRAGAIVPAVSGRSFEGRVSQVGVAADPATRTYRVQLVVRNPKRVLLPGMIAEARIESADTVRARTVPGEAILRDPDGVLSVFLYSPQDKRVHRQRIEVGSVYDQEVEVTAGLAGDELVVVAGQNRLRDGETVRAITEPALEDEHQQ